ncbi:MAG: glycine--tRNA ligase subunit beta [Deltaproteobacteria bacterium]|nr:glycine--tRNA ligase subunit beta [Deltaproteobacteria bacterium]MBW2125219.1 glycine--tRNA ligase subunit beta [Deltaproteobacteria bacterium]RLB21393.1 MAG: glycine--tRNA ligase subunit beta [Deltaproteobacteria bacterium]
MAVELLLEIGTEEIPSGYLNDALEELEKRALVKLRENRIKVDGGLSCYGTPRRLVLMGRGIAERQEDVEEEVTGPPKKVAFDQDGNPTKAAMGFAQRQGVSIDALEIKSTPKGEYLCVKRKIEGRPTLNILSQILPELIAEIPWPKSMRWGDIGFAFVRPIHWVLALLNGEVIPFEVAGIKSSNKTRGHRFMAPAEMEVSGLQDYLQKMKDAYVIIDGSERRKLVEAGANEEAKRIGGTPGLDPELVSTVANLVEYPVPFCGVFDEKFLHLPEPVLITAMKEHQKYFAVHGSDGKLMASFVAISNTKAKDMDVVRKGNERVLRARLADADFFFREDRKRPLADRIEDLKEVIYQADLGTSYEKVERFTRLADWLAERICPEKREDVALACRLCKCDLVTYMVDEFPSLQGIMGEAYARLEGYPEEVCIAIREHYLPLRAGGELPQGEIGAVVGLADRMDTVVGCFAVGLEPTGTADPFALRRHALAILRILEDTKASIGLGQFTSKAMDLLKARISFDTETVHNKVMGFFRERYKQMMLRSGYASDEVEAVISADFERINQLKARIDALKRFATESEEFEGLALTFKRVRNILKKAEKSYQVNPGLFKEASESGLWNIYENCQADLAKAVDQGNYQMAFSLLMAFKEPVDRFFDEVEILTKESQALRENRLGMLQHIESLFLKVVDFSKFQI